MAAAKHTPGPWEAGEYGNSFIVTANERQYDVAVVRNIGNEDNEANAQLIAAAPDLLDELRDVLPLVDAYGHARDSDRIRAVMAKAEGRSTGVVEGSAAAKGAA